MKVPLLVDIYGEKNNGVKLADFVQKAVAQTRVKMTETETDRRVC